MQAEMTEAERIDAEWIALSAFRGLTKIASHGDMEKSTYENALDLGGALYPDLLGPEVSVLKKEHESDITKEYRQKARLQSIRDQKQIDPLALVSDEIQEIKGLLEIAKRQHGNRQRTDQLKNRLGTLNKAKKELQPISHTENQLIFRDAYNVDRPIRCLETGQGHRDFELPNENILRLRVLHPDHPEHITGADIIYERHAPKNEKVSIVAVQYKIWEDRKLYVSDPRMQEQIRKLREFLCQRNICESRNETNSYRFPCCSAFLRPTDKLQKPHQKFMSSGEHIPICKIDKCTRNGARGGVILEYDNMREVSLSNETFEFLFNKGKIGSDYLTYDELLKLYTGALIEASHESVVIYAQEFGRT